MFQELGVLPGSEVFDVNPGAISREMGLNVVRAGSFDCDRRYCVSRENYGSYLLLYTREGTGIVDTCGSSYTVRPGDFALIDCYHKHSYRTDSKWKFDWIHVKGNIVEQFYTTVAAMKQDHVFFVGRDYRVVHTLDCLFAQLKSPAHWATTSGPASSPLQMVRLSWICGTSAFPTACCPHRWDRGK